MKNIITYLLLFSSFQILGQTANLSGTVSNVKNEPVCDALIYLFDTSSTEFLDTIRTDDIGNYSFKNLETNISYRIIIEKKDDFVNQLTVLDMILIRKHILEIEKFPHIVYLMASDVNTSGSLSTFDLVLISKNIMGTEELEIFRDWRFAPVDTIYNSNTVHLTEDLTDFDFYGMKVGDMDSSADSCN